MGNYLSSENRILTTHAGSLPRRPAAMERVMAKVKAACDPKALDDSISAAVESCVMRQAEAGLDIVADGDEKTSFVLYMQDRIAGLEPRPGKALRGFRPEFGHCLEDFERYLRRVVREDSPPPGLPVACAGPIEYVGHDELQRDLDNLAAAAAKADCQAAFMSSIAPSAVGTNEYYPSQGAFLAAAGEALRAEYQVIVDAGFLLQINDPFLPGLFSDQTRNPEEAEQQAGTYVDALNHSLRGIPPERIRYHISCAFAGAPPPRRVQFAAVARHMVRVNAAAYSFEACHLRHEDDDDLWDEVRLPDGKVIMPGLISRHSGRVEDPEQIAKRLIRFAERVGRESVVASADNGPSEAGSAAPHPADSVIWSKFAALREGADRASTQLWS